MLNPEMFERYAWKYMRQIAELCIDYGVVPLFHLDSNWDNGIKYFKELPRRTCILALDGMTDIFKAREVIGDHQCLMGNVPASMTSFAKPEEVEAYCKRLIEEVGPRGYIMVTGRDIHSRLKCDLHPSGLRKRRRPLSFAGTGRNVADSRHTRNFEAASVAKRSQPGRSAPA